MGPPFPRWAAFVLSLLILYHLGCVALNAMAATSGPWPGMEGPDMALPPQGVALAHEKAAMPYLKAIKQTHNYHFRTNHGNVHEAYLKVRLVDASGAEVKELRFPDPKAPAAVQRRQEALVRWLVDDQPVQPKMTEGVAAPGQLAPTLTVWDNPQGEPRSLVLTQILENEVKRDQPTFRPSPWSLVVVRSLVRHLCRANDADGAEVHRFSREPVPHRILMERDAQIETSELKSFYGRMSK
ncbi:MAG: hypothetical protein U0797_28365 [Gemmataceae bacterium]